MRSPILQTTLLPLLLGFSLTLSGCASATLNKKSSKPPTPAERIAQLERDTQTKDQELARVRQELKQLRAQQDAAYRAASYDATPAVKTASNSKSLRVPGVSVEEVQSALKSAGFNPGSVDGRFGSGTKDAVKRFQRKNGLLADGVVGQKTWSLLKKHSESGSY